ncbi:flagellar hook-length control protein FliK [Crateriforma conspicua]|uniref:Flagellar hook-length control protein FliK n=1 Tax=Crateriforma conspicua TaxID=2527996 RepID=A0A5C5YAD8_9PLAN|nr:flagellar hook-length control protein FliK [Crateriforma conspicua]TWT71275.1 Flagellar hook-length control protein FliK [Crateriforma conspicua]
MSVIQQSDAAHQASSSAVSRRSRTVLNANRLTAETGLVDPFAEIFAAMSVAQPVVQQTDATSEPDTSLTDLGPTEASDSSDNDSNDDSSAESTTQKQTVSGDADVDATSAQWTTAVETEHGPAEQSVDVKQESADAVTNEAAEIEATEVAQAETNTGEIKVEAETVVAAEGYGRRRSKASDTKQVDAPVSAGQSDLDTAGGQDESVAANPTNDPSATTGDDPASADFESWTAAQTDAGEGRRRRDPRERRAESSAPQGEPVGNGAGAGSSAAPSSSKITPVPDGEPAATVSAEAVTKVEAGQTRPVVAAANASSAVSAVSKAASESAARGGNASGKVDSVTESIQQAKGASDTASASKSKSAQPRNPADAVTRARLVQRVSKAFQHFGSEGGSIRLKLAPAELGSVRVEMQVRDKKIQARVVADSETAAEMLRQQLPELRTRLEAQGMQVDRLSVEQESSAEGENGFHDHQQTRDESQQDAGRHRRRYQGGETAPSPANPSVSGAAPAKPTATAATPGGGIDFRH